MKKKTKITYVIGNLSRGGAEGHLTKILPGLSRKFDVTVFVLTGRGEHIETLQTSGVRVVWPAFRKAETGDFVLSLAQNLYAAIALFGFFLRHRPQIVHFFLPHAYLVGAPVALVSMRPHLLMSRRSLNTYFDRQPVIMKRLELTLHRFMSKILGNSKRVIAELREEGARENQLVTLYNGVEEAPAPSRDIRAAYTIDQTDVVIAILANLIPYKGHADLLKACAMIRSNISWKLLIIGNDTSNIQQDLTEHARKAGIADRVIFTGKQEQAYDFLLASDVLVSASHEEGFSNSILEAMAARLPCLVTDVGGNAEAVQDNETGFVVPAHNPKDMARRLDDLLNYPARRKAFADAGYDRYKALFSLHACIDAYASLYDSLTDERNAS